MLMYKLDIKLKNNKMIYSILIASTYKDIVDSANDFLKDKEYKNIKFELFEEDL